MRLRDLPWHLLVLLSTKRTLQDIEVCVAASVAEPEHVFMSVQRSLDLMAINAPATLEWVRRNVRRLLLSELAGGHYLGGLRTCRIGAGYAQRVSALELAMMIVHEATHARLDRAGVEYRAVCRERIEAACVRSEIRFAERVPGSEEAIARTERLLESRWWEDSKIAEGASRELTRRGVPTWLTRLMVRRRNRGV